MLEAINEVDISDCTDVDDIIDRAYADVASIPAIDAVPVVRCKDCKYSDLGYIDSLCFCTEYQSMVSENGFCYQGTRTDEKEND